MRHDFTGLISAVVVVPALMAPVADRCHLQMSWRDVHGVSLPLPPPPSLSLSSVCQCVSACVCVCVSSLRHRSAPLIESDRAIQRRYESIIIFFCPSQPKNNNN